MTNKYKSLFLASMLLISSISNTAVVATATTQINSPPSNTNTQGNTTNELPLEEVTNEVADSEDVGDKPKTQEDADKKVVGLSSELSKTISEEVISTLKSLTDEEGNPLLKFGDDKDLGANTDLYTSVLLAQLQTYELLYSSSLNSGLTTPITAVKLEGDSYDSIDNYITSMNVVNRFIQAQITAMESTEEYNENLKEAMKLLLTDTKDFRQPTITKETPMSLEDVRVKMLSLINVSIPKSINSYMKYLNSDKDSDDVSALMSSNNKVNTKKLLTIIKQWSDLPHIEDEEDSTKLSNMESDNLNWITALADLIEEMEKEVGGETDADTKSVDESVNPEYATSVLGRLGSSLFTVERSANADDDPNRPLTGTLGWVSYSDNKKGNSPYDEGPAAKDDYLAMFAATSVYRPFISKVGDRDYYEAYKSLFLEGRELVKDDNEAVRFKESSLGPIDILSQVQNLKKPLYYLDDTSSLGVSTLYGYSMEPIRGITYLLTVKDIIDSIEDKRDIVAVTINGVFKKESDSWSFYNYSLNKDSRAIGSTSVSSAETMTSQELDESAESNTSSVEGGTTTSTVTPTNNRAVAGIPITSSIVADKEINGGQEYTRAVFEMTYNPKKPGAGLVTGALMHNIYHDTVMKSRFKERMAEAVYVDVVGNIVLNDGLVVLPAASNPTYWVNPPKVTNNPDSFSAWNYNPYTVAFMDSYPAIYAGGTAPANVSDKNDKDKYVLRIVNEGLGGTSVAKIEDSFDTTYTISASTNVFTDFKVDGQQSVQDDIAEELWTDVEIKKDEVLDNNPIWVFGNSLPLRFKNFSLPTGGSIFPYTNSKIIDPEGLESFDLNKVNYDSSIVIAKNMYAYIIGEVNSGKPNVTPASGTSTGGSSDGTLREGFLFNNIAMPVLTGVSSGIEFDKSNARSDLLMAGGDANIVEKWIIDATKSLAVFSRSYPNVLSVADSNDSWSINAIMSLLIKYGFYILFILFLLIIYLFLRQGDFLKSVIKSSVLLAISFTALFVLPLIIPLTVSWTSDIFSRNIVINSMMANMEMSEDINTSSIAGTSGTSLKLYHMSPTQAKEMTGNNLRVDGNYLSDVYPVNNNLGIYIKGQEVRLDMYSFWRFNPLIIGVASEVNNPNDVDEGVPQIYDASHSASKFVADNKSVLKEMQNNNEVLDYYMPFNMLQGGFVNTLNKYLKYYAPPQSVIKYPNGLVKNSYVTNSYIKSLAFLSAEPSIGEVISSAQSEEGLSHLGVEQLEVDIVNQHFYPYGDVLGLQEWVDTEYENLPNNYKSSIWIRTLYEGGYYTNEYSINKRLDLANRVNRAAYDFLLRTRDANGTVSDETLIKLTALYATFEFNKEVSSFNNVVYPRAFTLNELTASDVVASTILGQSKQFVYYDTSIASNVYYEYGIVGLSALMLVLSVLILYSLYVTFVLPIIVITFLSVTLYCIIVDKSVMPSLLFVSKFLGVYLLFNLILTLIINLYKYYNNIYMLTSLVCIHFIVLILIIWFFILKRSKTPYSKNNWVGKQTGGYGSFVNNSGGDTFNSRPSGANSRLEESEGMYGRQNSHSSREY